MKREVLAAWLFLLVAVLSATAALVPMLKGRPMNVTYFALGGFWLIMSIGMAAKARKASHPDGKSVQ